MLDIAAASIVSAIASNAISHGYVSTLEGEFTDNLYASPVRLTCSLLEAMMARLGINDVPTEIGIVSIATLGGDGEALHREDIDTSEILGYGDGLLYTMGQLYGAIAQSDPVHFMPTTQGDEFILRLAIDTYAWVDDIELVARLAWDSEEMAYRIEEVHMMRLPIPSAGK